MELWRHQNLGFLGFFWEQKSSKIYIFKSGKIWYQKKATTLRSINVCLFFRYDHYFWSYGPFCTPKSAKFSKNFTLCDVTVMTSSLMWRNDIAIMMDVRGLYARKKYSSPLLHFVGRYSRFCEKFWVVGTYLHGNHRFLKFLWKKC